MKNLVGDMVYKFLKVSVISNFESYTSFSMNIALYDQNALLFPLIFSGPVWNGGIQNTGMKKNAGIEWRCYEKTGEWKDTGKEYEVVFGTKEYAYTGMLKYCND
ncbi:unnamed protein product [Urochloa humidicola]